ncbi:MAG: nucleotidyltransferase domain-containing protein [Pirellulales bacterium]|nr:nucleotidyltransferase domain-containing protein [Pirellulales bacterium]
MSELEPKLPTIHEACRQFGVRRLELFGSRARDDYRPESDYDFIVEFHDPAMKGAFKRYFSFKEELEALLGATVDLMEGAEIRNPYLKRSVDRDRTVIYAA